MPSVDMIRAVAFHKNDWTPSLPTTVSAPGTLVPLNGSSEVGIIVSVFLTLTMFRMAFRENPGARLRTLYERLRVVRLRRGARRARKRGLRRVFIG